MTISTISMSYVENPLTIEKKCDFAYKSSSSSGIESVSIAH